MPVKEVITLQEAAKILCVHPLTLRNLCKAGRVPGAKVGKQWRFRRSSLLTFVDGDQTAKVQ